MERKSHLLSEASLVLVAVIWGWGFVATRIAVDDNLSPHFIMMCRFFVAMVVFGALFWKTIRVNLNRSALRGGILVGSALFLGFLLQTIAMEHTTPSNAAFLTATNVVMVPFLWWAVIKKRPPSRIMITCFTCLIGVCILSIQTGQQFSVSWGDVLSLLCAFFFASQIVLTSYYSVRMNPQVLIFLQFAVCALLSILSFLIFDHNFASFLPSKGLLASAYLGVFSTCLCYFLSTMAQQRVSATKTALILSTESLFGSFFSVLMGYEPLTVNMIVGGSLIFLSILTAEIDWKSLRKKSKSEKEPTA